MSIRYRVFAIGYGWLPAVDGVYTAGTPNENQYAGIKGRTIGGISMMRPDNNLIKYQVTNYGGVTFDWVTKYNGPNGTGEPYAGSGAPVGVFRVMSTYPIRGRVRDAGSSMQNFGWSPWVMPSQTSGQWLLELRTPVSWGFQRSMDGIQLADA